MIRFVILEFITMALFHIKFIIISLLRAHRDYIHWDSAYSHTAHVITTLSVLMKVCLWNITNRLSYRQVFDTWTDVRPLVVVTEIGLVFVIPGGKLKIFSTDIAVNKRGTILMFFFSSFRQFIA